MKAILSNEWKKLRVSKGWRVSLLAGIALAVIQAFWYVGFLREANEYSATLPHPHGYDNVALNILWMGADNYSVISNIFYTLLPILAAMPMAASWMKEKRNGYHLQTITRSGIGLYQRGKWWIAFLSGGMAIAIPLTINLLIAAVIYPMAHVSVLSLQSPVQGNFASGVYYHAQIVYMLLAILIGFLWGGVSSVLALGFSRIVRNRILVPILPFLLFLAIEVIVEYMNIMPGWTLGPMVIFQITSLSRNPAWLVAAELALFYVLAWVLYRGRKKDAVEF